jgi:hypothetical protein
MPNEPNRDIIPGNNRTGHSVQISSGPNWSGSNNGTINRSGDHDWFRVYLYQGDTYRFDDYSTSRVDTTLALWDGNRQVRYNDGVGRDSHFTYTAQHDGYYYIDAGAHRDASTGSYRISVTEEQPYDNIGTNSSVRDVHDGNDSDWYRILLNRGRDYSFDLNGGRDSTLGLYDRNGHRLRYDNPSGSSNPHVSYHANNSDYYYLEVDGRGTYPFTLSTHVT